MATCDPQELLASAACIDCLSPGLKETLKLQLLCEIANGAGDAGITELTGDVTAGPGTGSVAATIAAGAVTLAKMANLAANSVIGNSTGLSATPQALSAGSVGLAVLATTTQAAARAAIGAGTGSGTVTDVSVTTANGVSGSVATSTTTPAITLTLGAITPTSAAFSGTAGAGFVSLLTQSSDPSAPASGFTQFADSTGRFSWIRQSDGFKRTLDATLTANRVYTLPDATTTIAGLAVAQTFTLANTFSANGALSAPAVSFTGTAVTGGSASTTAPLVKIGPGTDGGYSTAGNYCVVNAPAAFSGYLFAGFINGTVYFTSDGSALWARNCALRADGAVNTVSGWGIGATASAPDVFGTRKAAANLQLGAADAAAPVAQTLSIQSVVAGTSNTAGAAYTRITSLGTGTGGGGDDVLKQALTGASGTTQNTAGTRMYRRAKETTLTEATATKLFTVPLAAGGYIGMTITATVFASDGTDHHTITSTLNVNAVAKSTTITGTITQVDGTAANSSGTLTPVTYTVVDDGSNVLSVKCAATSSLAQTTLSCKWSITMLNSNVSATITPL